MGVLSEAYKEHPQVENKYITPINFDTTKIVPESHAWVENNPSNSSKNSPNNNEKSISIPVIDLNDPNVLEKINNACEKWGFLQITNHGISNDILEKLESQVMKLFNLPFEEKTKVLRKPDGAAGYGVPRIAPFFSKLMWCEGFTIIGDSLLDHAKVLWPHDYQEFCDVMVEYQTQLRDLSDKLLGLILKSLNIPEFELNWINQDPDKLSAALQLNSYPKCPDPTSSMGLAQHTDSFIFTIVHQSANASGLQVLKDGLGWVSIDPVPGALVVNSGDLLHIISNGRFPSMFHRAVVNNEAHRISVAYFYGPPLDFVASPYLGYPGCQGPSYTSMTVKEYVAIKARLLDSALASIKCD